MQRQVSVGAGSDRGGRLQGHDIPFTENGGESEFLSFIRAVTEGMALLVGLLAIETLFFGRGAYAALDLHPFWLPVILVALQHGLYGGVATAALASWLMDWPPRAPGVDISTYNLEMAHLPIQWLLYAVLIGLYRHGERQKQAEQERELARLRHSNQVFADEIRRIDEELWRFEVAAATASPPVPEGQFACDGENSEPDAHAPVSADRHASGHGLANAFVRSVAGLLGVDDAHLFLLGTGGKYLDVSEADPCPMLGSVLGVHDPIVRRLVERGAPIVIDRTDGTVGTIAAVAVGGQNAGTPRGVIAVPYSSRDGTDVDALITLSEAMSAVLDRMDELSRNAEPDQVTGAPK